MSPKKVGNYEKNLKLFEIFWKKSFAFGKKVSIWYRYQNWTLVLVPDTKTWFQLYQDRLRFTIFISLTYALSFYRSQNVLCQSKNLIAFSASSKTFVPAQKPILLKANHLYIWHKMFVTATIYVKEIIFWCGTKCI